MQTPTSPMTEVQSSIATTIRYKTAGSKTKIANLIRRLTQWVFLGFSSASAVKKHNNSRTNLTHSSDPKSILFMTEHTLM